MTTLADIRAGWLPDGEHREPACYASAPLWDHYGLAPSTTIEELRVWWTVERACEVARLDGAGPRVGAVAWIEAALGVHVLTGAILAGANLEGADLTRAVLDGAMLDGAMLHDANLTDADLHGANLTRAVLDGANLEGADLRGADLTGACLAGADRPEGGIAGWVPDADGYLRGVAA